MKLQPETIEFLDRLDDLCLRYGVSTIKVDDDSVYFYKEGGLDFISFMKYENGEYHEIEESSLVSKYNVRNGFKEV